MGTREIALMCPSAKYGVVTNAAGQLRVRCTGKLCRREGIVVFHVFDLATGACTTVHEGYRAPRELLGQQGDDHVVRRAAVRVS